MWSPNIAFLCIGLFLLYGVTHDRSWKNWPRKNNLNEYARLVYRTASVSLPRTGYRQPYPHLGRNRPTENIDTFIDFSAQPQQIALYYVLTALLDHTNPAHCRTAWIAFHSQQLCTSQRDRGDEHWASALDAF